MTFHPSATFRPLRSFATNAWRRFLPAKPHDSSPRLRPITRGDESAISALLLGLSTRSCRLRYSRTQFTAVEAAAEARRLLDVDHTKHVVIVAAVSTDCGEQIVGVGELVQSGTTAEIAVLVADQRQREGIGKKLIAALQQTAERKGIAQIHIDTLKENDAMCILARRLGIFLHERHEFGEVHFIASLYVHGDNHAN